MNRNIIICYIYFYIKLHNKINTSLSPKPTLTEKSPDFWEGVRRSVRKIDLLFSQYTLGSVV